MGSDAIQAYCAPIMTTGGIVGPLAGTSWATWKKGDRPTTPHSDDFQAQQRDSAARAATSCSSFIDSATKANCCPAILAVPRGGIGPWGGSSAAARESLEQLCCTLRPRSASKSGTAAAARPQSAAQVERSARPCSASSLRPGSSSRPPSASATKVRDLARPVSASAVQVRNCTRPSAASGVRAGNVMRPSSTSSPQVSTAASVGARGRQGPYQELFGGVLLQEPQEPQAHRATAAAWSRALGKAAAAEAHGTSASPCSGAPCPWGSGGA